MNKYDSWKRTEDIEIDLTDLLRRICRQWKQILICAIAFAVITAGFEVWKYRQSAGRTGGNAGQDTELSEGTVTKGGDVSDTVLTEEEKQSVISAVELKADIRGMEEYMNHSVLMKTDPYHKHKVFLLYSIENADRKNIQKITESYLSFLVNGGAADALKKSGSKELDIDKNYLAELITAYQKVFSYPYQVSVDDSSHETIRTEALFYADLTGPDEKLVQNLAEDIQLALQEYSKKIRGHAGSHKLTLISQEKSVLTDNNLQAQQRDKRTQLAANRASLKAATDSFSDIQMNLYHSMAEIADQAESDLDSKADEALRQTENAVSAVKIKYVLAAFLGGAVLYCCIFICCYLLQDAVKSKEEIKRVYTFPLLGSVFPGKKTVRKNRSGILQNPDNQAEQLIHRIRLLCKQQKINSLCLASDFAFDTQQKEVIDHVTGQLESFGIHALAVESAGSNTAVWDTLTEKEHVLLVCQIGRTTHRIIDDAMRFYSDSGISVIGAVAFEQDK